MDVLCFLAEHQGEVVSRDGIIAGVWAKRFVADSALSRSIAELRRILGDDAREPTFIETIAKRGYRLAAAVARTESVPRPRPSSRPEAPAWLYEGRRCALLRGEQEIALDEGENVVGRTAGAAVRLDFPEVSRRHARVVVTGGRAVLEDLGSKNGTYLRGRRVQAAVELTDGDEIVFGRALVVFRLYGSSATTATGEPP